MAQIVEKAQGQDGKWVVRVANDALTRSMFLSFDHDPTNAEVRDAFQEILNSETERNAERDNDGTQRLSIRARIEAYQAGKLTNTQARTLLDDIIGRLINRLEV